MTDPKSIKELATGRTDLYRVDPRQLNIKTGWNCREINFDISDEEDLALGLSIKEVGVKVPLEIFWEDSKAYVNDGHRRLLASLWAISNGAELKTVPVTVVDRYSNDADKLINQLIRNMGKALKPIEKATNIKRLIDMGWKGGDIAIKIGVTAARVSQLLGLLAMPEPVKQMVQAGTVSPSLAVQTVKDAGEQKAVEILNNAVATAHADGRSKAKPSDFSEVKKNPLTQIKECFDNSTIDNSNEDGTVIIAMNEETFEIIRQLLKL